MPTKPQKSLALVRQENFSFFVRRGFPRVMERSHMHSDIEMNFVLRGSMHYFLNGQFHTVEAENLTLFWAGRPHALMRVAPDTECIWVVIPLTWFLQWQLPGDFTQQLLRGAVVSALYEEHNDYDAKALEKATLQRWVEEMKAPSDEVENIVLLEVQARLLRFARQSQLTPGARSAEFGSPMSHNVQKIASYISQHYQMDISIADIAHAVGLHPNYAMQVFKEGCGMSVWEYLLRLRVSHAQRLLLATDLKVSQVAQQAGFASMTRFHETFSKHIGQSPGQFRKSHRL